MRLVIVVCLAVVGTAGCHTGTGVEAIAASEYLAAKFDGDSVASITTSSIRIVPIGLRAASFGNRRACWLDLVLEGPEFSTRVAANALELEYEYHSTGGPEAVRYEYNGAGTVVGATHLHPNVSSKLYRASPGSYPPNSMGVGPGGSWRKPLC